MLTPQPYSLLVQVKTPFTKVKSVVASIVSDAIISLFVRHLGHFIISFEFSIPLCFILLFSFLFAFPLVIAFQIAFYKILVAYLRDFGRHAYIAREKLALAASCLACGYTCFLLNACHRSVLLTYVQIFRKPSSTETRCNYEGT